MTLPAAAGSSAVSSSFAPAVTAAQQAGCVVARGGVRAGVGNGVSTNRHVFLYAISASQILRLKCREARAKRVAKCGRKIKIKRHDEMPKRKPREDGRETWRQAK